MVLHVLEGEHSIGPESEKMQMQWDGHRWWCVPALICCGCTEHCSWVDTAGPGFIRL